ncbi:HAD-IA family hydrolase (plasmid) [Streptomyces clavuligerus]|nr:HAD family hydrolase [Streptomyces clavuligerus]EDY47793.1 HAD-superfamily hydrolase subfamily IA [Streptomyces clavuligerus]MBY6307299.1 HAD-IA family hydrolase [Streptomyces clavuligerus]QCS10928.1 haloacid dehalogenase [Streptomyces clavuligerus]QPJ98483.1 HAD-IA family hydrolase [Streptomyces clavuligerus]
MRALILDFVGVLTAEPGPTIRAWCTAQGLDPGAWGRTLQDDPEGRSLYTELELGRMGQAEWNARTAPLLGPGVDPVNLMGRAWEAVPTARRMAALARTARASGLRLALLSNSFGLDPHNPYTHAGIWDLFDVHVISEAVGLAKPDPAIYHHTLDLLDLPPEACVFADDHAPNLAPAAALGITTVHVTDEQTAVARLSSLLGLIPPRPLAAHD